MKTEAEISLTDRKVQTDKPEFRTDAGATSVLSEIGAGKQLNP